MADKLLDNPPPRIGLSAAELRGIARRKVAQLRGKARRAPAIVRGALAREPAFRRGVERRAKVKKLKSSELL